jgi:hypothetical protein
MTLLHDKPTALLGIQVEASSAAALALPVLRLSIAEHLGTLADQRRTPGAWCSVAGFVLNWKGASTW